MFKVTNSAINRTNNLPKENRNIGRHRMTSSRIAVSFAAIVLFGLVAPAYSQQSEATVGGELFEKMQSDFADAYNRKDIAAMAAFFSENGVRITPAGIFRGRDAIGGELTRVIEGLGLHEFSGRRTVSRLQGGMVFNAGEWQAKLGDGQQLRGYYSALVKAIA
jgi:ketosteroid isomerase-like protein